MYYATAHIQRERYIDVGVVATFHQKRWHVEREVAQPPVKVTGAISRSMFQSLSATRRTSITSAWPPSADVCYEGLAPKLQECDKQCYRLFIEVRGTSGLTLDSSTCAGRVLELRKNDQKYFPDAR